MNRSYSKIRHIQESNMILENRRRLIKEMDDPQPEAPETPSIDQSQEQEDSSMKLSQYNSAVAWLEKGNITRGFKFKGYIEGIKSQGASLNWIKNSETKIYDYEMWLNPDMTYIIYRSKQGESFGTSWEKGTWSYNESLKDRIIYKKS